MSVLNLKNETEKKIVKERMRMFVRGCLCVCAMRSFFIIIIIYCWLIVGGIIMSLLFALLN